MDKKSQIEEETSRDKAIDDFIKQLNEIRQGDIDFEKEYKKLIIDKQIIPRLRLFTMRELRLFEGMLRLLSSKEGHGCG